MLYTRNSFTRGPVRPQHELLTLLFLSLISIENNKSTRTFQKKGHRNLFSDLSYFLPSRYYRLQQIFENEQMARQDKHDVLPRMPLSINKVRAIIISAHI